MSRLRASFAFLTGAAALIGGFLFRFFPQHSTALAPRLDGLWCAGALALVGASLLAAFVARPRRDLAVMLGLSPVAAVLGVLMPILALLEPIVRDVLIPAGLEAAGGFTLVLAALRF